MGLRMRALHVDNPNPTFQTELIKRFQKITMRFCRRSVLSDIFASSNLYSLVMTMINASEITSAIFSVQAAAWKNSIDVLLIILVFFFLQRPHTI